MKNIAHEELDNISEYIETLDGFTPNDVFGKELDCGQHKYMNCIAATRGDIFRWIVSEIQKLSEDERKDLNKRCRYVRYVMSKLDKSVGLLSELYQTDKMYIHRLLSNSEGKNLVLKLFSDMESIKQRILLHNRDTTFVNNPDPYAYNAQICHFSYNKKLRDLIDLDFVILPYEKFN